MMEDYKNGYWSSEDAVDFHNMSNPQNLYVSPHIAREICKTGTKNLLDYGCGGAYVDTLLPYEIEKTLYDINPEIVPDGMEQYNCRKITTTLNIPDASFDCIFLGMVLVTLKTKEEYAHILSDIRRLLKKGGTLIIADPHPCFRWQKFRYNNNSLNETSISYFDEHAAFPVQLGTLDKQEILFDDYHHSLAFNINMLAEAGLFIHEMIELKDATYDELERNSKFPPYYTLICR